MQMQKILQILECNFSEDKADLVKVSPIGFVTGIDGRQFDIDATSLIKQVNINNLHIPLDINHDFKGAVGWFDKNSFEIKDDGIYAKLELNAEGLKLINDKTFRYLSPVYNIDYTTRKVLSLHSVGLVNIPNLLTKELNNIKEQELMPDNEDVKQNAELEIKRLKKELQKNKIDNAISNGELLPNAVEFAMMLNEEQLNSYLSTQKEVLKHLQTESNVQKPTGEKQITDEEKAVNKQLGLEG